MPQIAPDSAAAVAWFKAWHGPDGPWLVVEIDPAAQNPAVIATLLSSEPELRSYLADRNGRVNLYWVPNVTVADPPPRTTPTKEQITLLMGVYVDLDLPKEGPYSLPTPENLERLLSILRSLTPAPTAIIYSGGGYQAFWLFPHPLSAVDYLTSVEAIGKRVAASIGSDAVQNINRLMRLPGTVNVPTAAKLARGRVPATAEVVEVDWSRTWSPDDDPVPEPPEPVQERVSHVLADLPIKVQKAITTGDASGYGGDRSRLVFAVATALVRRGWTDEEIAAILADPAYMISAHCRAQRNPSGAAIRQAQRAREVVSTDWDRTAHGTIDPNSPANIRKALADLGIRLMHNTFQDRSYVNGLGPIRLLDDPVEAQIRVDSYDRFGFLPSKDVLSITASTLARRSAYHPVIDYLSGLSYAPTGSTENLTEEWLIRFAGARDTPYVRAVSRLILVAAVRRVRRPGCKFDEMMVLISPVQGTEKSLALATLAVDEDWFTDSFPLRADERKTVEQLAGRWIVECAELQGIHQSDVETVKSILSRQVDRARLAYGHHPTNAPRQCVFFGTTNSTAFLRDRTNRRFWPVHVERFDIAALRVYRDALWAEAAHLEATGMSIRLDPDLWDAAAAEQEAVRQGDPWTDTIGALIPPDMEGRIASNDVWKLVNKPDHQRGSADAARITESMLELGWTRSVQRIAGRVTRCFVRGSQPYRDVYVYRDPVDGRVTVSHSDSPTRDDLDAGDGHPDDPPF